jgi:hypothetical protein
VLTALFVAAGVKSASRVPYKYLVLTWLAVAAILISRRLIREAFLVVQVRKMALVADPRALRILRNCANELHLRRRIRLLETWSSSAKPRQLFRCFPASGGDHSSSRFYTAQKGPCLATCD